MVLALLSTAYCSYLCHQLAFGAAQAGKAGQSAGDTQELWLYLEEAKKDKPLVPIAADNILLFFKLYDPKRQTLSYLGRCYAWETNRLPALMPFLRRKAGYTENVALQVTWCPLPMTNIVVVTVGHHQQYPALQCASLSLAFLSFPLLFWLAAFLLPA